MFARWKSLKGVRGWYVWKLKLIDARLYFVSIFVGLLTGLVAVPYHYLLQFFFDTRRTFSMLTLVGIGIFRCFGIVGYSYFCRLAGRQNAAYYWRRYSADTRSD